MVHRATNRESLALAKVGSKACHTVEESQDLSNQSQVKLSRG
jgi:hypothetical protein